MSAQILALAGEAPAGTPALCTLRPAPRKPVGNVMSRAVRYLTLGLTVAQERRMLRAMTPDQLTDLGMRVDDVVNETRRPFWDLPLHRL